MSRIARLLVPLTSIAALTIVVMLLAPIGAIGNEREALTAIGGDLYLFGRDGVVDHPVKGNVQVYGGNILVQQLIQGDLLVAGGDITIRAPGRVTGNVIHAGGNVQGAELVNGRVYSMATLEGAAATIQKTAVVVSLLFVWFVAAVIVTLASGRDVRFSSVELRSSALHCFALGLVALTSFVLTAIVFSYLVPYLIGIPLLAALAVFAILTKIYGMIAVFHAVGSLVAGARNREQLATRKWLRGDLAMVV
ncbi:MAG: hypothetical protein ACXVJT_05265, partial [Thermoanaerobaculia bacterium]